MLWRLFNIFSLFTLGKQFCHILEYTITSKTSKCQLEKHKPNRKAAHMYTQNRERHLWLSFCILDQLERDSQSFQCTISSTPCGTWSYSSSKTKTSVCQVAYNLALFLAIQAGSLLWELGRWLWLVPHTGMAPLLPPLILCIIISYINFFMR